MTPRSFVKYAAGPFIPGSADQRVFLVDALNRVFDKGEGHTVAYQDTEHGIYIREESSPNNEEGQLCFCQHALSAVLEAQVRFNDPRPWACVVIWEGTHLPYVRAYVLRAGVLYSENTDEWLAQMLRKVEKVT